MIPNSQKKISHNQIHSLLYLITKWIAHLIFPIIYQIDIKKEGNFPRRGPSIIAPKHQYWTDIPLVMLAFRHPLHFVAKKELFRTTPIRFYLLHAGAMPLDRDQSIRSLTSFKSLYSYLKSNRNIVIFPEGTYFPGSIGQGKSRLIQMILRFQSNLKERIPFIPMGIHYGERRGLRRRVEIRIGRPLFAEGKLEAEPLTHHLMKEIGRLSCLHPH